MSNLIIVILLLITLLIGLYKKIDCYNEYVLGVKESFNTIYNILPVILTFTIALTLLTSSTLLNYLKSIFNFDYIILVIQGFVRLLSSTQSLTILLDIYEKYGVDANISLLSTSIHYVCDSALYIIPFYLSLIKYKNYNKLLFVGILINIITMIITVLITKLFIM